METEVIFGGFENKEYPCQIFEDCRYNNLKVTLFTAHEFNPKYYDEIIDIEVFFDLDFHAESYLLSKNIPVYNVSSDVLSNFLEAQIYFHRLWDRIALVHSTFRSRERHFIEVLTAILSVISEKKNKITVIWREAPHSPPDIVLFFVCKFLNIQCFFAIKTLINSNIRFVDDFRPQKMKTILFKPLCKRINNYNTLINSVISLDNYFLNRGKDINSERTNLHNNTLKRFKRFLRAIQRITFWVLNPDFQPRNKLYRLSSLKILMYSILLAIRSKRYQKLLKNLSESKLPNKPFIFYPLNFQPEMTTDPTAGFYTHPHLIIREILQAMPSDMYLVVKEHPRQFLSYDNLPEMNFRDSKFLNSLTYNRRVVFIDRSIPNEKIIPKSCLVVGSTGSALWEAIAYGVPSLSFAHTWHGECDAAPFFDHTKHVLGDIIKHLLAKNKDEIHKDVIDFLQKNKNFFYETLHIHRAAIESNVPFDLLVKKYVECTFQLAVGNFTKSN